jgi:hypothetical protein
MTSYPNSSPCTLSDSHSRQLKSSDIALHVAAARGYRTIRHRSEVPDEFADWQRRPGLLVPTHSPDGQTKGHQLKPNEPIRRKDGSAPKYETPTGSTVALDVNPLMLEAVQQGEGDLWITEGCKKVDSLASRGEPAVGFIGVWNMAVPKTKGTVPLPCWQHVRLRGRRVIIVFDADARLNPNVQEALGRAVMMLESLEAIVLVVYLPAVNGDGKAGIDDYLAADGTVKELRLMAAPYQPVDVGAERMSRDERLRAAVEDLERRWWAEEWKGRGGHTDRDVALKFVEAAARCGKIHADGIRVQVSWGTLQVGAKVARETLSKALVRLEELGFMYRDNKGRKPDKTGAFVLRAKVDQYGRGAPQPTRGLRACAPGGLPLRGVPDGPRLRWSRPKYTPRRGLLSGTRCVRSSKPLPPRDRIERLGKVRGAVVDALEIAGGALTLEELCEVLYRKQARDVRRRVLPMLEDAGVIEVDADTLRLAADWSERLEAARVAGGEPEADELAERRRKLNSRAYHRRNEAPKSQPSAAGLEAIRRSHEQRRTGLAAIAERAAAAVKSEEVRKAEAFVRDRLAELGRIRLALLQDIWHDAGGDPWSIPRAVEALGCRVEELPEFDNRRFVFAPMEGVA